MIELINIFYLTISFLIIFSFPFSNSILKKKLGITRQPLWSTISLNSVFLINIFLILSFINLNLNYLFYFLLLLSTLNLILINKIEIKKNLFYIILLIILIYVFHLKIASNLKLEWDAATLWIFRTLNFYEDLSFKNFQNIPGVLNYPHLGTYLWALFWKGSFVNHEYTGRIIFTAFYFLSLIYLIQDIKFKKFYVIIFLIFISTLTFDQYLFSGYQEPLIFAFLTIMYFFINDLKNNTKNYFYILPIILCSNIIIWIKNEGIVLIILVYLFIFFNKKIKNKIKILIFTFFILEIILKKYLYTYYFGDFYLGWQGYEFIEFKNILSFKNLEKITLIFLHIGIAMVKYPIFVIYIFINIIILIQKKFNYQDKIFLLFFLLNIIFIFMIYFLTKSSEWAYYLTTTVDRLLYQSSGIYMIYLTSYLNKIKIS